MIGDSRKIMSPLPRSQSIALTVLTAIIGGGSLLYAQSSVQGPPSAKPQPNGMFDLEVARFYEQQDRWKEAEQEYLQAGRVGTREIKQEAITAIQRLKNHRPSEPENFEFELAELYKEKGAWKEAEQHYAAAAKDAPKPVRDRALSGIKEARDHRWLEIFVDDVDQWLGYTARFLGIVFVLVILWRLWKVWRAMEIVPFEAPNDSTGKQVNFWLASALEEMPSAIGPIVFAGRDVLTKLPGVEGLEDPAQDVEIGAVKLPLADWIKLIKLPRVRVFGRWDAGEPTGTARARILRRRHIFGYAERESSLFSVPARPSDSQDLQLKLFAYDVLVKSIFLRRHGR